MLLADSLFTVPLVLSTYSSGQQIDHTHTHQLGLTRVWTTPCQYYPHHSSQDYANDESY
jgi:hypothetical protein